MKLSTLRPEQLRLYAVTDRRWLNGQTLADAVEAAIQGGVTCVQIREKHLDFDAFLSEAKQVAAVCRKYGVPFIVNDNVSIAMQCGADGVHLGQSDLEIAAARELLGAEKIIGATAKTVDQALAAQKAGADYLGVGAVYATGTKTDTRQITHETLREVCSAAEIPAVAIGGITAENAPSLTGTGIAGIAVVSAIFAQTDICSVAVNLREIADRL